MLSPKVWGLEAGWSPHFDACVFNKGILELRM